MAKQVSSYSHSESMISDIKKKSLQNSFVTIVSAFLKLALQLGSMMILGRILSPEDYGINAMALTVIGFANIFSSLGLSTVTIQRSEISHDQLSTLFWINLFTGVVLTFVTAVCSPLISLLYQNQELLNVMLVLSLLFLINSLSIQHTALLHRRMNFFSVEAAQILAILISTTITIFAALKGYGYWALVINSLTLSALNTIFIWIMCRWMPGLPKRRIGIGSFVKFGLDLLGFNLINYFSRNLDHILIGKYHGSLSLGIYSKAYQLLMFTVTNIRDPITNVSLPALSSLKNDKENFRAYYLKIISLLAFISMPLTIIMFVNSKLLIEFFLGEQWVAANNILKIFAITALFQPVISTVGLVLVSTGQSKRYLKFGIINSIGMCCAFVVGLPWGNQGVAIAYLIVNYLLIIPNLFLAFRGSSIKPIDFLNSVSKPLMSSILMGAVCIYVIKLLPAAIHIVNLSISSVICITTYLVFFILLCRGTSTLKNYFSYIKVVLGR